MPSRALALIAEEPRIGITGDGEVSSGYDSIEGKASVVDVDDASAYGYEPHEVWTKAERKELADHMIERWKRYGEM